jgi:hypothetical protein
MTELEAVEKSIILWESLVTKISQLSETDTVDLCEYELRIMKAEIDPNVANCTWHCYLCEFFYDPCMHKVDCSECCISRDCGTCNIDDNNQYQILISSEVPRIFKLRAANRMLRVMKTRRRELLSQGQK